MKVLLTSFKRHHESSDPFYQDKWWRSYSIAVYQPKWYLTLPTMDEFLILDEDREWVRPRNFIGEDHDASAPNRLLLGQYAAELLRLYGNRAGNIARWVESHKNHRVALCCWCPHDKAARRQLDAFGSFVCHSAVVEVFLKVMGVTVIRDDERERMVRFG